MLRLTFLASLAVAALLAGCASPPAQTEEAPLAPAEPVAAGAPVFSAAAPVAIIPNTGHESFLAISPDGRTILTCAHGDFREPVHKFASVDGGTTFVKLDAGPGLPAGDCEVALGPEGAWSYASKTDAGVSVDTTTDGGATWTRGLLAGPPLNGLADRQWLAYVGTTLLLSYQPGTQAAGSVLLVRSTDLGRTWSSPMEVAGLDPAMPLVTVGDFLVGPAAGEVRIPMSRAASPTSEGRSVLMMLRSLDAGASWDLMPVGPAFADPWPSGAAVAPDGTLLWAYSDRAEPSALLAIASTDGGSTWSTPIDVAGGLAWDRPWASGRPDGTFDVAWLSDGTATNGLVGLAVTRLDVRDAPVVQGTTLVAPVDFIEFAAVAHDAAGRAYVAVIDAPSPVQQQELSTDLDGTLLLVSESAPAAPTG